MTMTDAQYQDLTADAVPVAVMPGEDRRARPRMKMNTRAPLTAINKGVRSEQTTVVVRELSMGGIGFMTSEKMSVGRQFVIELPTRDHRFVSLHGNVMRVNAGGSGNQFFNIGAVFTAVNPTAPA